MRELITAEEEPGVRLVAYGLALLAIAARQRTCLYYPDCGTARAVAAEARGIADAFVAEARRLSDSQKRKPSWDESLGHSPNQRCPDFTCRICYPELVV